jgi:hypothetical protein
MREIVRRALCARPELTRELARRGMFRAEERAQIEQKMPGFSASVSVARLGSVQVVALLAQADAQFAACAVLRELLDREELRWLDRLLRFQKPSDKRDELARIVERALEGRKGNVRHSR